jgi:hypothetical protein
MNVKNLTRTLNGTKTIGSVPLRSTIIANNFCPFKWALGFKSDFVAPYKELN